MVMSKTPADQKVGQFDLSRSSAGLRLPALHKGVKRVSHGGVGVSTGNGGDSDGSGSGVDGDIAEAAAAARSRSY